MLRSTPPGLMDLLRFWHRPRGVGSRMLTLGLAACLASGSVWSPAAAAQRAAPGPSANAVSGQVPTPTVTPTPQPAAISPTDLFGPQQPPLETRPVEGGGPITVDATPSPQQQAPITVSGCGSPDYIFQGCTLVPIGATEPLRRLEAQAIATVLQQYQLPDSERARVLRYARNEVRAVLFAQLIAAIRKESGRSDDEQVLVEGFTRLVREKRVEAATVAQREYQAWRANPCSYEAPRGFTYPRPNECASPAGQLLATPASPGFRAFAAYGITAAYKAVQDDPNAAPVFSATSRAALVGYGYAAALGLGVAGAVIGANLPITVFGAVFPYAVKAGGAAGTIGVGAIGGPLLVITLAILTAVLQGIAVTNDAAVPGQLQEWLDGARSYDVGAIIRTTADLPANVVAFDATGTDIRTRPQQELFAVFILNTLPDYPSSDPAPAAQQGDPRLVVAGSPVDWLQYSDDDGSQRAVRLSGRWFADRAGSAGDGEARLTLQINYRDAAGAAWTARRVGNEFVIVRVGDPTAADYPAPRQSADLSVVDGSGRAVTARVGG